MADEGFLSEALRDVVKEDGERSEPVYFWVVDSLAHTFIGHRSSRRHEDGHRSSRHHDEDYRSSRTDDRRSSRRDDDYRSNRDHEYRRDDRDNDRRPPRNYHDESRNDWGRPRRDYDRGPRGGRNNDRGINEAFGEASSDPTPPGTVPISQRKRPRTAWDIPAPGYETIDAATARMTGKSSTRNKCIRLI